MFQSRKFRDVGVALVREYMPGLLRAMRVQEVDNHFVSKGYRGDALMWGVCLCHSVEDDRFDNATDSDGSSSGETRGSTGRTVQHTPPSCETFSLPQRPEMTELVGREHFLLLHPRLYHVM